ncbi:MAG TPA: nicotinamide-nucleotide amidohydrolase family protein [Cellvibrio sp.]|nr:nicotinamide-nucleotide amidohydrolase family protein [Cellvibrio sp.]
MMNGEKLDIEKIVEFLRQHRLMVATAESCTAGLVAAMLVDIPGCGDVLEGGFITYSQDAKKKYLGVSREVMDSAGLTSEAVARELIKGLQGNTNGSFLIAVTGTAESDDELCGLVCFAYGLRIDAQVKIFSESRRFEGDRNEVRKAAALHALQSIPHIYRKLS